EHTLRVFENRVLRRIFGPKRDEGPGGWRKLHNEELHTFYSSPCIIRMIKSGIPTNILYAFLVSPHSCYIPCLPHLPSLDHSNYTWRRVQVMKFFIMQFSPTSCHFINQAIIM
ncbi:hypothetical protein B7P43_G08333, partial [Cryptotermes secundus]